MSEVAKSLAKTIEWLMVRHLEQREELQGMRAEHARHWGRLSDAEMARDNALVHSINTLATLINQHHDRLARLVAEIETHPETVERRARAQEKERRRKQQAEERLRRVSERSWASSPSRVRWRDCGPLPVDPVLPPVPIVECEQLPEPASHTLSRIVQRQGDVIMSWHYNCFARSSSRRYEGFSYGSASA